MASRWTSDARSRWCYSHDRLARALLTAMAPRRSRPPVVEAIARMCPVVLTLALAAGCGGKQAPAPPENVELRAVPPSELRSVADFEVYRDPGNRSRALF